MHVRESQPQMLVWVRSVFTLVSPPQNPACNSAFCVAAIYRGRACRRVRAKPQTLVWAVPATTLVSTPWSHAGDPLRVGAAQCVRTGDVRNHRTVKSGFCGAHARESASESRWNPAPQRWDAGRACRREA